MSSSMPHARVNDSEGIRSLNSTKLLHALEPKTESNRKIINICTMVLTRDAVQPARYLLDKPVRPLPLG